MRDLASSSLAQLAWIRVYGWVGYHRFALWGRTHTLTPRQVFDQSGRADTPIPPEEETVRASRVLYDLPTHVTLGAKAAAGRAAGRP